MMAFSLTALISVCGLAVDLGRLFVVRAELVKAVDGGALAGARMLPRGGDVAESVALDFAGMNYAPGYLGSVGPSFGTNIIQTADESRIQVTGNAVLPMTLMRIVGLDQVPVSAFAEATRRPFQIALVLDTSGSLDPDFAGIDAIGYLRTAATQFVRFFDDTVDEMALVRFASGRTVPFPLGSHFTAPIAGAIASFVAEGGTTPGSALDEATTQITSSPAAGAFRAIVFFTDGRPTSFRDIFRVAGRNVDGVIGGYQDPRTNGGRPPTYLYDPFQIAETLPYRSPNRLPNGRRATNRNILDVSWQRALDAADNARDSDITIFAIGLGNPNAGPIAQPDAELLVAIANVPQAPDPIRGGTIHNAYYDPNQPEGEFFFAPDATQLAEVFNRVAQEIVVRLTQ